MVNAPPAFENHELPPDPEGELMKLFERIQEVRKICRKVLREDFTDKPEMSVIEDTARVCMQAIDDLFKDPNSPFTAPQKAAYLMFAPVLLRYQESRSDELVVQESNSEEKPRFSLEEWREDLEHHQTTLIIEGALRKESTPYDEHPMVRKCRKVSPKKPITWSALKEKKPKKWKKLHHHLRKRLKGGMDDIPYVESLLKEMDRLKIPASSGVFQETCKTIARTWIDSENLYALSVFCQMVQEDLYRNLYRSQSDISSDQAAEVQTSQRYQRRIDLVAGVFSALTNDSQRSVKLIQAVMKDVNPLLTRLERESEQGSAFLEKVSDDQDPVVYLSGLVIFLHKAFERISDRVDEVLNHQVQREWIYYPFTTWFWNLIHKYRANGGDAELNQATINFFELMDLGGAFDIGGKGTINIVQVAEKIIERVSGGVQVRVRDFSEHYFYGIRQERIDQSDEYEEEFMRTFAKAAPKLPEVHKEKGLDLALHRRTTLRQSAADWVDIRIPILNAAKIRRIYYYREVPHHATNIGVVIEFEFAGQTRRFDTELIFDPVQQVWRLAFPQGGLYATTLGPQQTHELLEYVITDAAFDILCQAPQNSPSGGRPTTDEESRSSDTRGHTRRLPQGASARPSAIDEAAQYGIILGPNQTFVNPYRSSRGRIVPVTGTLANNVQVSSQQEPESVYDLTRMLGSLGS